MADTSWRTVEDVARFCWQNQQEVDGEEKNYIKNIAEGINCNPRTVTRAVRGMKRLGIAKTFQKGNKKCVRITIDLRNGTMEL